MSLSTPNAPRDGTSTGDETTAGDCFDATAEATGVTEAAETTVAEVGVASFDDGGARRLAAGVCGSDDDFPLPPLLLLMGVELAAELLSNGVAVGAYSKLPNFSLQQKHYQFITRS